MCKISDAYERRISALRYLQHCSRPYGSHELKDEQKKRIAQARKAYNTACANLDKLRAEGAK